MFRRFGGFLFSFSSKKFWGENTQILCCPFFPRKFLISSINSCFFGVLSVVKKISLVALEEKRKFQRHFNLSSLVQSKSVQKRKYLETRILSKFISEMSKMKFSSRVFFWSSEWQNKYLPIENYLKRKSLEFQSQ